MALTEEEKKKKMQQDISLDEWYNTNQQNIERQAQQQYEDAYVNRELMNKYLNQNIASQGLADTGIANLYAQQANTDYMNQRANIANAQQEAETNLFNQYYSEKKAENDKKQQDAYNLFTNKVNNSLNEYGKLSDDTILELQDYIINSGLDNYYTNLANQYIAGYIPTQEQKDHISEQEEIKTLAPYYEDESNRVLDEISSLINLDVNKLSDANVRRAYEILEKNRKLIGEDNYIAIYNKIRDLRMTEEDKKMLEQKEKQQIEQAKEFQQENSWYDPNDSTVEKYLKYFLKRNDVEPNEETMQEKWNNSKVKKAWDSFVKLFTK